MVSAEVFEHVAQQIGFAVERLQKECASKIVFEIEQLKKELDDQKTSGSEAYNLMSEQMEVLKASQVRAVEAQREAELALSDSYLLRKPWLQSVFVPAANGATHD